MTPPQTHMHNRSNSLDPSDSENTPQLSIDTSQADLLKVTAQFLTLYVLFNLHHVIAFRSLPSSIKSTKTLLRLKWTVLLASLLISPKTMMGTTALVMPRPNVKGFTVILHLQIQMMKIWIVALAQVNSLSTMLDINFFFSALCGSALVTISLTWMLMRTMMQLIGSRMIRIRPRISSGRLSTSFKRNSRCSPCVRGGFDSR